VSLHKNITYVDGHIVHSYEYANAAARTGASGFVAADIGRIARQTDDNSFYVLTAVTPTWASITGGGGGSSKAPVTWGSSSVSSTTTTRYLHPWYEDSLAPTTAIQWRVPFNGTISLMRVHHGGTAGNGNAIVYTLRKNNAAQSLTVSLASTAADGSDLANSVTVAAGDLVDVEVTKAASVGTSPSDITCSVQYVPT
jgi:hypothetical protein